MRRRAILAGFDVLNINTCDNNANIITRWGYPAPCVDETLGPNNDLVLCTNCATAEDAADEDSAISDTTPAPTGCADTPTPSPSTSANTQSPTAAATEPQADETSAWIPCASDPSRACCSDGTQSGNDQLSSSNVHCGYTWFKYQDDFSREVEHMRQMNPDIAVLASHPFTTCGMLKEMARQRWSPKLLVGLTSSTNLATLRGCSIAAEGMVIPTSFAAINDKASDVSAAAGAFGGETDLHSAAAWEILHIVKHVIEQEGVEAKSFADGDSNTVEDDRWKIRDGLAALTYDTSGFEVPAGDMGLLGPSKRQADGETSKPFLFVKAQGEAWEVLYPEQVSDGGDFLYVPSDIDNF